MLPARILQRGQSPFRHEAVVHRRLNHSRQPNPEEAMIVVCPLSRLQETVDTHKALHVVTLLRDVIPPTPRGIAPENHLVIPIDDICDPLEGCTLPDVEHVAQFLDFAARWDRTSPLVVHCWAGISRSTATAFAIACARAPHRDEEEIALAIRSASPTATPNGRLVALADAALGRNGRMLRAAARIGRGRPANEGLPFVLSIDGDRLVAKAG
jgi:predicted protein tyrosine phosphatase